MKKFIFLLLLSLFVNSYAHKQQTHVKITLEAYDLLKRWLGYDVQLFSSHLQPPNGVTCNDNWDSPYLTRGAWL